MSNLNVAIKNSFYIETEECIFNHINKNYPTITTHKIENPKQYSSYGDYPRGHEFILFDKYIKKIISPFSKNLKDIIHYGFTEMLNNVFDHSDSDECYIIINNEKDIFEMSIIDNGIGIFDKIRTEKKLLSNYNALGELTKGKLTTAKHGHSGEGIFFTSKMFDEFSIISNEIEYNVCVDDEFDIMFNTNDYHDRKIKGTAIILTISKSCKRTDVEVFNKFSDPENDDYAFSKTLVPVKLCNYLRDSKITGRASAAMVLSRLTDFSHIVFDFDGIDFICPSFTDEVFRVFQLKNPNITINTINASNNVERMIKAKKNEIKTKHKDQILTMI